MRLFLKIAIILLLGGYTAYGFYVHEDHNVLFDSIIDIFLLGITLIVYLIFVIIDVRAYRKKKKRRHFIATITCLCVTLISVAFYVGLQQRDRSPVVMSCFLENPDFNGINIDFRKDGSYKLTSWSMGFDIYRGRYTRKDSIITLDTNGLDHTLRFNKFVMTKDIRNTDTQYILYEIDATGHRVLFADRYMVRDSAK